MKHFLSLTLFSLCLVFVHSSSALAQAPAGFKTGYIILNDNTRKEGFVKDNFKSKAAVIFQDADGKKTTYSGNDIKETGIEGSIYISYSSDFFKLVSSGAKASLFQKVTDASGQIIFNGSEAVGVSSGSEGAVKDFFIRTSKDNTLHLITKKNFQSVISTYCTDCPSVTESIKNNSASYEKLEELVQLYNQCK
jgi:hypothetical protein